MNIQSTPTGIPLMRSAQVPAQMYHFDLMGSDGAVLGQRDTSIDDDWQAEATARILLLSGGICAVEAWARGRFLYRIART
jgi:hypothetical protein